MTAIKLTKDIPHEGLVSGDVIDVDPFSAASMCDRKVAEAYTPEQAEEAAESDSVRYGGQDVRTIDDIVDPDVARNRRVMSAVVVGAADDGPVHRAPDSDPADAPVVPDAPAPKAKAKVTASEASAAHAAGGDAGGGAGS